MKCALVRSGGDVVPTNAGILFFGRYPQQHVIQGEVVCVLFRDAVGASRYADRKILTGTLQGLIDGAEAFLNRYIAVGARIEGWKRIDIPEHSIGALREAVVNAVVHRDYSKRGESVRVFYYADRVEIHSPGLLLPGITVEQMERGVVQSKLRNPVLAGLLRDLPGYIEQIGSGIRFMLDETKRLGLPAPEFREMNEFVVTFRAAPLYSLGRGKRSIVGHCGKKKSRPHLSRQRVSEDPPDTERTPRRGDNSSSPRGPCKLCYALQTASPPAFSCARADSKTDSKTGRQPWISVDSGRISIGLWSAWKTIVDSHGEVMPMERFEPSTLSGLVFETSAYTVPPHRLVLHRLRVLS